MLYVWVVGKIMRKLVTTENKAKIIELYQSGLGSDTIGARFDIHPNTVLKILKREGIERRGLRRKIFPEDEPKIVELYQQGLSAPEIAEKYEVSHSMILKYLEQNGIDRRSAEECHRIYPIQEDFFDCIDTQEKAYFLGFLYADGGNALEANYVRIDLSRKDKDILEKLARLIYLDENPEQHIRDYEREKEYKEQVITIYGSYLNINSKHICHKLYDLGCENKKSLTLVFPKWLINSELQRHFIRGYYDGDGGVSLTDIKTRGATSKIISTIEFCYSMREIIMKYTGVQFGEPYNDVSDKNVYSIHLCGNRKIANFLNWLYKSATIYLDRKYNLYLQLLEKNKETDELILAGTRGYQKRYYQK
jgi:intein-encoded DNA endonuclease-like protein